MKHAVVVTMLLITAVTNAQSNLTFDVASVKPSNPDRIGFAMNGGPGTPIPSRLDYLNVPLRRIVQKAYGIRAYELIAPSWMTDTDFDIAGTFPEGTTAEQFQIMLQNLLAERFHLTLHRERRELTAYDLMVARGGSKLKESDVSAAPQLQSPSGPMKGTPDGFPIPFPGRSMIMRSTTRNGMRMAGGLQTTEQIAQMLTDYVGARVVDKTGLIGKYDFKLEFAGDQSADGAGALVIPAASTASISDGVPAPPSIFTAVQEQLGLRLEKTKDSFEVLVIDRVDKVPTEN